MILKYYEKTNFFKVLEKAGLIRGKYINGNIVPNYFLIFNSYFMLLSFFFYMIKLILTFYFKSSVVYQAYLGNLFFYEKKSSLWGSLLYVLVSSLNFTLNVTVNHLHKSKKKRSYMEILVMDFDKQKSFKVVGLPENENKKFWSQQFRFISKFHYIYLISVLTFWLLIVILFHSNLEKFDLKENFIFILHYFHFLIFIYYVSYSFCSFLAMFVTTFLFFSKRFKFLSEEINKSLKFENKIENQNVKKLIYIFNKVALDLLKINQFSKYVEGIFLIHGFLMVLTSYFYTLAMESKLKIVSAFLTFSTNIYIISVPYFFANEVINSVHSF